MARRFVLYRSRSVLGDMGTGYQGPELNTSEGVSYYVSNCRVEYIPKTVETMSVHVRVYA